MKKTKLKNRNGRLSNIKNFFKHFNKICVHKFWVAYYCFKTGIPWRGIKHDMSKFSPVEFWEGVKYYQGTSSPIDACKKANGWSKAWQHHKGHNDHHYEYWQDDFDHGGHPLIMPKNCAIEMICDYLGAGHAYYGKNFSYSAEYLWWLNKRESPLAIHPLILEYVDTVMKMLSTTEELNSEFPKKAFGNIYDSIVIEKSKV